MSAINIQQAILDDGILSINFFNGRLLTAEDLSQDQQGNKEEHHRLGIAISDGVVSGLEVKKTPGSDSKNAPTVTITAGMAVSRSGQVLKLPNDIDLGLIDTSTPSTAPTQVGFGNCQIMQGGIYIAGEGIYLLTIAPATGNEGKAKVSGLGNTDAPCNTAFRIDGVQFHLLTLNPRTDIAVDLAHVRNRLAYECFGITDAPDDAVHTFQQHPFGPTLKSGYGLLDSVRTSVHAGSGCLSDDDVPLALLLWTVNDGLVFVDMWSVRRRVTKASLSERWNVIMGDRRLAESEAMFLQFQDQLAEIQGAGQPVSSFQANQQFRFLPAAGYLPVGNNGFDWKLFLGPLAPATLTQIDEGLLRSLVHTSFFEDPIFVLPTNMSQSTPLAAVDVYRLPSQPDFVVFARSPCGRIRVTLDHTVETLSPGQLYAQSPSSSTQFNAVVGGSQTVSLDDLPADTYSVQVALPGYQQQHIDNIAVVDGQVTNVSVQLQELRGSITLELFDIRGQLVQTQLAFVFATSVKTNQTFPGTALTFPWYWWINNLPADTYTVTVFAEGYQSVVTEPITITPGQNIFRSVYMYPFFIFTQPSNCIATTVRQIPLHGVRLCMVRSKSILPAAQIAARSQLLTTVEEARPGGFVLQALHEISTTVTAAGGELTKLTREAATLLDSRPWLALTPVSSLPEEVIRWLGQWQSWLSHAYPNQGIERVTPTIYINTNYQPPRLLADIPKAPQAYAVFGSLGIPLLINPESIITKRPFPLTNAAIRGIGPEVIDPLKDIGITQVDQVAGAWTDLINEATGQGEEYSRYLINDAMQSVGNINNQRLYFDGVDATVEKDLQSLNITDDVALANADQATLADKLGSQGFAARLINQAREIVPQEAWSLDQLGLTSGQISLLEAQGVRSKGEFIAKANTEAGRQELATNLALSQPFVQALQSSAISQLTASSIELAPKKDLIELPGMNVTLVNKLSEANITTVEQLAQADTTKLATITNLSEATLSTLVQNAGNVARTKLDVVSLAPISTESATKLKDELGVRTVADLASKKVSEIVSAFNGDERLATAILEGAKTALKLREG